MKKILFAMLCILVFASFCYAAAGEVVEEDGISAGDMRATSNFTPGDSYMYHSFVSDSSDPTVPTNIVENNTRVNIGLHAGITQTYHRHYIISDAAGTMVDYTLVSTVLTAGTDYTTFVTFSLPPGDYTFTFAAGGSVSGIAVADQVRFSVR